MTVSSDLRGSCIRYHYLVCLGSHTYVELMSSSALTLSFTLNDCTGATGMGSGLGSGIGSGLGFGGCLEVQEFRTVG